MVVGCIKRPRLDVPLAALTVLTAVTVSTHFRIVGRYYFQIVPFILYFAAAAIIAAVQAMRSAEVRRAAVAVAMVPLAFLVGVHVVNLPSDLADVRDFNAGGRQQSGPTNPDVAPIFDAVAAVHRADGDDRLLPGADDDAVHRPPVDPDAEHGPHGRSTPTTSPSSASRRTSSPTSPRPTPWRRGMVEVWSNSRWILWKLPGPPAATPL